MRRSTRRSTSFGKTAISETPASALVYLDSNIFIGAFETGDPASGLACLIAALARLPGRSATSEYTLGEVLSRKGSFVSWEAQKCFYRDVLFDRAFLRLVSVDRDLLERTGDLRLAAGQAGRSLRLADAVHIASALRTGCQYLLTADVRLGSVLPPEIRYIAPTKDGFHLLLKAPDA